MLHVLLLLFAREKGVSHTTAEELRYFSSSPRTSAILRTEVIEKCHPYVHGIHPISSLLVGASHEIRVKVS